MKAKNSRIKSSIDQLMDPALLREKPSSLNVDLCNLIKETDPLSVSYFNLTLNDLVKSRIPDKYLQSIWVEFKDNESGYTAVHVNKHVNGPYILLCSNDKDKDHFRKVEQIFIENIYCHPEKGDITDRTYEEICKVINLEHKPGQKVVAALIKYFYKPNFNNVTISQMHLNRLPCEHIYKESGLPPHKIKMEKY